MEKAVKDVPPVSMVMPQEGHPVIASHVLALWHKLPTSKYAPSLSLSHNSFFLTFDLFLFLPYSPFSLSQFIMIHTSFSQVQSYMWVG